MFLPRTVDIGQVDLVVYWSNTKIYCPIGTTQKYTLLLDDQAVSAAHACLTERKPFFFAAVLIGTTQESIDNPIYRANTTEVCHSPYPSPLIIPYSPHQPNYFASISPKQKQYCQSLVRKFKRVVITNQI
jgi:hypothetical protein